MRTWEWILIFIEVWCLILSHLDYYPIRFATVSKTFYNQIVFQSVNDLSNFFNDCFDDKLPLKLEDVNDEFIQRFTNLKILYVDYFDRSHSITDIGISALKNLTILNLYSNNTITDNGIKGLTNLTDIILYENHTITDEELKSYSIYQISILVIMR
jgi:hypothetical protein